MAGFPRSGSTLLSSLLNQNPLIYSGPSSPVLPTLQVIQNHFERNELFAGFPKIKEAEKILCSIAPQFYSDIDKKIIIDKNRVWTSRFDLILNYLNQEPKIICPVRDIREILTSMIMLIRKNPYYEGQQKLNFIDEALVKSNIPLTDFDRCQYLISPKGIVGQSASSLIEALDGGNRSMIHFVEYNDLVSKPQETLNGVYDFLGEEKFEHDFKNVKNLNRENDSEVYGFVNMHEVRPVIKSTSLSPEMVLSSEILELCDNMEFWRI